MNSAYSIDMQKHSPLTSSISVTYFRIENTARLARQLHSSAEGIEIGKFIFAISSGVPFQGVQIHRVRDTEILEEPQ